MSKTRYETRMINGNVECRTTESGEVWIEGRGIVFNEWSSDLGGFTERIAPEAVQGMDWSDVYSFINHDPNVIMGRTKSGTMSIEVRGDGVYYKVKPPKSAKRYIENIQRGDIDGSSFTFRVAPGGDSWEERDDGSVTRTITKFDKIKEMGGVVSPAYPQTTAETALRSLETWRKDHEPQRMDDATKMKGDTLKMREKDNMI